MREHVTPNVNSIVQTWQTFLKIVYSLHSKIMQKYHEPHSRDDQEVGVAHKVKSPESQPQFS